MDIANPILRRPAHIRAAGYRETRLADLMAAENIPGASVVVIEGGEVAWARCYGVCRAGQPEPVTPETRFQAASISKPVTALAALSLVQEGRLALDEDIRARQAAWKLPDSAGWLPRVTLRQLLTHSGGVTVPGFPGYAEAAALPTLAQVLDGAPPANTPPIQVDTLPGLHFRYSGGGYTILQRLLEDVTGQPFEQVLRERVFAPLGMQHSTFALARPDPAASGHRADGQPLAGGGHRYPESAAAGLWTTPLDLARVVIALEQTLAGRGEPLLRRELVDEMLRPQVKTRDVGLEGWYGLGFFLTQEDQDWYFGHGGSNEGFRASLIAHKGRGQATVIMTNADSGWALTEAWDASVALEYGWPGFAWVPPAAVVLEPGALEKLCGSYRLESGETFAVELGSPGGLRLVPAGQDPLAMLPREPLRFFLTQLNAEVVFEVAGGQCVGLELRQNGEGVKAQKGE